MVDLTKFEELNNEIQKPSWERRAALIYEQFPSVRELDWNKAFANDLDLFARVVKDILKADQAGPSRPGPRPALDYGKASRRLHEIVSEEHSGLPFTEAARLLTGSRSIRHISSKTGLNRNHVHRLLTGKMQPDVYAMTQIARAYGKKPQYFREYRQTYIIAALMDRLAGAPDAEISLFRKLKEIQNGDPRRS